MKRGPQLGIGLTVALVAWVCVYAFAPLSPAVEQVVEAVRASPMRSANPSH
jgi:hypothetical protein